MRRELTVDFDDFRDEDTALDLLWALKGVNPKFRYTLFAIPGLCSPETIASVPDFCELAVHGWKHESNYECAQWTRRDIEELLVRNLSRFCHGFKAPGWQISRECLECLADWGYWVSDRRRDDAIRPRMLRYDVEGDPTALHGHIQTKCENDIRRDWYTFFHAIRDAEVFHLVSERVDMWVTK